MVNCQTLSDETVILSGIQGYHDIRIGRSEIDGVKVWSARTRDGGLGSGRAETRCGALHKYFLNSIGDTAEAKRIYEEAAAAIQTNYPEERIDGQSTR